MKTYTETELRRIDALVAEHCFAMKKNIRLLGSTETITGYTDNPHFIDCGHTKDYINRYCKPREYTTDPAASDALDDWILTQSYPFTIQTRTLGGNFWMNGCGLNRPINATHSDKKICRALFALKLKGVEV